MARPAPAEIPEIYAQQPQQGFDTFGDLRVLRDIQPDFFGMDFIDPSGIDIGAIDIPDAVTLLSEEDQAAIAEGKKFLSAEKKFAEAVAYLKAYNQGLAIDSERFTDDSGKFTDESLEAFFEGQRDAQDALQVARANYEAVGGKPETLMNKILGGVTTVGAAPSAGAAAAGIPSFNQVLYNIPSILAGQPVVTGSYSDAGTQTPLKVDEKDGTIIAATTGIPALDEAIAGVFGDEAIITETGDLNVPSGEDVIGAIGDIFTDPTTGTLVNTVAPTDKDKDKDTIVGVDATKVSPSDDPNKLGDPNGDSNSSGNNIVDNSSGSDTLDVLTDSQPKFTPVDIAVGSVDSDTPTIRAGGRDIVGNTLSDDEIDRILAGGMPAVAGGYDDPSTTPSIKTGAAPAAGGGDGDDAGGGFGMPTETPSATGQGLTGVSTEKTGVADIGDPYQLSASLYENIMRILQQDRENRRDDRNRARTYYGGGSVRASDRIDEIARIIRG